MSNDTASGGVSERLHALDLVRSGALLLGVVFHAALPFLPGYDAWLVMDDQRSEPISWLAFTVHSFRMATFFLLAGYFGRMMLRRKGTAGFLKDRAKRILAPLVVFWPLVIAGFAFAMAFAASTGAVPADGPAPPPSFTIDGFPLTHLWFLWVLLLIYALTLLLRGLIAVLDRGGRFRAGVDKAFDEFIRFPFALPVALAVPVGLLLVRHSGWIEWWGIPTPDAGLVPNAPALVAFTLAFWTGWLAHRLRDGLMPLARLWVHYITVALVLTVTCLAMAREPDFTPGIGGDRKLVFASLYGLLVWLWSLGLIGAALRLIRGENPRVRYLADSSYWVYIVHLPLLVALEALVARWALPAEVKLVLVFAVAMAIMLFAYHWLIRASWLGAWLNGRRLPR